MLTKKETQRLLKSGDWMLRFDDDGVSYAGFRWNGIGEWTEASDWKTKAECGNGLHGQSPKGAGYCQSSSRMVLCETEGEHIVIDKDKMKVRRAKIIAINEDIPVLFLKELLKHGGSLKLAKYNHPLPANLASVGGSLYLEGYNHPLPANLASVGGYLYLEGYNHPLPANLASVGGSLYLEGYNHPLPAKLKRSKGIK